MKLVVLDSLSLPGDPVKPNEDAFGHDDHAALVMDGATMLGDGRVALILDIPGVITRFQSKETRREAQRAA